MPLTAEFRIFWFDHEVVLAHRYWGDLAKFDALLPLEALRDMALRIPSRFFTMDVAFLEDDSWVIVELGDGQVAGLPSPDLASEFCRRLKMLDAAAGTV